MKRTPRTGAGSPARQIAGFIDKFDPKVERLIRTCRSALRKRLPTAIEQVYDNYNFLALGFCSSERTSDCIVSLAASAKGVALSFYHGAELPDPEGILLGGGNQNRFLRLESAATLSRPAVEALIAAAVAQAKTPLPTSGRGYTMVKSASVKQRPRQTAGGAKTASPRAARRGRTRRSRSSPTSR
ncbi:MAG TPA: hypothetical protein VJM31_01260 [Vicinamibacterales bacterium]|nr:hypothetical protein [Vicinamibacterales bacterium]